MTYSRILKKYLGTMSSNVLKKYTNHVSSYIFNSLYTCNIIENDKNIKIIFFKK